MQKLVSSVAFEKHTYLAWILFYHFPPYLPYQENKQVHIYSTAAHALPHKQ